MDRTAFEHLQVIRRACENKVGCSEVCRTDTGELWVRLRVRSGDCQREVLSGGGKGQARLDRGVLELLLPYREGGLYERWLDRKPDLGQRRDACLSLVAQCVETVVSPCVITLAARTENLRLDGRQAWLQMLPDWGDWQPGGGQNPVSGVAELCRRMLTDGYSALAARLYPKELRLLCARQGWGDYVSWSQLQRDLAAIPDRLVPPGQLYRRLIQRLWERAKRYIRPAVCLLTAALVVAALVSLAGAYQTWRSQQEAEAWPGVTAIGDQRLDGG